MSEVLQIPNFDSINIIENAILDADASLGQPLVTLLNIQGIAANNKLYVGQIGSENGEILTVLSVSGKNVTFTGNLSNNHYRFEPICKLYGDQIKVYRALNVDGSIPSDVSFSQIGSAIDIDADQNFTLFEDGSGSSNYWYKTTYFNSVTLAETSLAQSLATRGSDYGRLVSIESIRNEAGLTDNTQIGDARIAEIRETSEGEVLSRIAAASYTLPLQTASGRLFIPPVVEAMARILSAGRLLSQEFPGSEEDAKNGYKKIKDVQNMFDALIKNELVLLDDTGVPMARSTEVSGWPDDTTASMGTDGIHGEPFQTRMSKRF